MKWLGRPSPFHLFSNPCLINRFIFDQGVVIYYLFSLNNFCFLCFSYYKGYNVYNLKVCIAFFSGSLLLYLLESHFHSKSASSNTKWVVKCFTVSRYWSNKEIIYFLSWKYIYFTNMQWTAWLFSLLLVPSLVKCTCFPFQLMTVRKQIIILLYFCNIRILRCCTEFWFAVEILQEKSETYCLI